MNANSFGTRNLGLAAFLVAARELPLIRVEVDDLRQATFFFDDKDQRGPELEAAYLSGTALVGAAEFHRQLRALRKAISERAALQLAQKHHGIQGYEDHNAYRRI